MTAHSGQPLTLSGANSAGIVIVKGRLQVKAINSTELNAQDLHIRVAHSDSGAQADFVANGAGLIVATGTSGLTRSLQWNYVHRLQACFSISSDTRRGVDMGG